jgi:hypothetical protein
LHTIYLVFAKRIDLNIIVTTKNKGTIWVDGSVNYPDVLIFSQCLWIAICHIVHLKYIQFCQYLNKEGK